MPKISTAMKMVERHHGNIANIICIMGDFATFTDGSAFLIRNKEIKFGAYNSDAYVLVYASGDFVSKDGTSTNDVHESMIFDSLDDAANYMSSNNIDVDSCFPCWETVFVSVEGK